MWIPEINGTGASKVSKSFSGKIGIYMNCHWKGFSNSIRPKIDPLIFDLSSDTIIIDFSRNNAVTNCINTLTF